MKRWAPALLAALAVGAMVVGIALDLRHPAAHRDGTRPPFALSQLEGEIGLVNVWATWCAPCRREIPALLAIADQYESKGVRFVAVNADDGDRTVVEAFVKAQPESLKTHLAFPGDGLLDALGLEALPTTVILDRKGREVKRFVGAIDPAQVREALDRVIAGRAP